MRDINLIPPEELGKGSPIKLNVCEHEVDMYWKVAIEVLEVIAANNKKGEPTVMIVPFGPLGPYARIAELVIKYPVSLKNCVFINMDEYLKDENTYIDKDDPLSFRGGMDRTFYSKIDGGLTVPPENRIFPEPGKEYLIMDKINEYGKLDMVFGGVGINGHYAFNEPEDVSADEFMNRTTRCLKITRETKTINAFMNCGANLDAIPDWCITVGMKEIFKAEKVVMCMPRDWNAAALRKVLHGEVTAKVPCSLFQRHPNAVLYAAAVATACPVPEIRVYNK